MASQRAEAGPRSSRKAPAPMCPCAEMEEARKEAKKNTISVIVLWLYGVIQHLDSQLKVNLFFTFRFNLYTHTLCFCFALIHKQLNS